MIAIDLLNNLALLAALSVLSGYIGKRCRGTWREAVLQGALFGAVAVVGMLRPLTFGPGLFFDGRSVVLSLCGLFFGPLAVGLAGAMAFACRLWQGGGGQWMGLATIVSSCCAGWAFNRFVKRERAEVSAAMLYGMGVIVHMIMVLLMALLPREAVYDIVRRVAPTVLVLYPLATVLIGKVLSDQRSRGWLQAELRDNQEEMRTALYSIGDAILTTDRDGRVRRLNPVAEHLLGWSEAEARDRPHGEVFRIWDERDGRPLESPVARVLRERRLVGLMNHTLLEGRDGRRVPVADSAAPILDEGGRLTGVVLVFRDQSAERAAQRELQAERDNLRAIMEASPVAILVFDERERVADANRAAETLFGTNVAELRASATCGGFLNCAYACSGTPCGTGEPCQICAVRGALRAVLADGQSVLDQETEILCGTGTPPRSCWVRFNMVAVVLGGRRHALAALHDITPHRRTEEAHAKLEAQFRHAQKMEAIGRLAGGVAHDFNNILQAIVAYGELLLEHVPGSDPCHEYAREIVAESERGAKLTRQLLAFARKQTIDPRVVDLNGAVAAALKMFRRLLREDIELQWEPCGERCPVKMDLGQLDQILANLAVNARDAIDGLGTLSIRTERLVLDEAFCAANPGFAPGAYVRLSVADDGCGMDRATLDRLFEPFFTTKGRGQGTGLGLATVYGIVKQNHGFINVRSEPQKGTTFQIYLPAHDGDPEGDAATETPPPPPTPPGSETVLIVDDEEALLRSGRHILEGLGYTVLTAGAPAEALQTARTYPHPIHVLLTDVVMPGMSGRDLWLKLKAIRSETVCIFMSGYTANIIAQRSVIEGGVFFLQKPFSKAALANKLREALSAAFT